MDRARFHPPSWTPAEPIDPVDSRPQGLTPDRGHRRSWGGGILDVSFAHPPSDSPLIYSDCSPDAAAVEWNCSSCERTVAQGVMKSGDVALAHVPTARRPIVT